MTIVSHRLRGDTVVRLVQIALLLILIFNTFSPKSYSVTGSQSDSTQSQILWMPFIDTSVPIKDLSGYENHATPNGGVTWVSEAGGSYRFDGADDYIYRESVAGLSTTQVTFSYWSKQEGTSTNFMHTMGLFGGHRATVYVAPDSYLYVYKFSSVSGASYEAPIATLDGEWHHTAVVFDGSRLRVYVDGAERVDVSAPGVIDKVDDSIFLGTTGYGSTPSSNWFKGLIDGVKVYSRALSSIEVQNEYYLEMKDEATACLQSGFRAVHEAEAKGSDVSSLVARLNQAASLIRAGGTVNLTQAIAICVEIETDSPKIGAVGVQNNNVQFIIVVVSLVILFFIGALILLKFSDWFWATWLNYRRGWRFERN